MNSSVGIVESIKTIQSIVFQIDIYMYQVNRLRAIHIALKTYFSFKMYVLCIYLSVA